MATRDDWGFGIGTGWGGPSAGVGDYTGASGGIIGISHTEYNYDENARAYTDGQDLSQQYFNTLLNNNNNVFDNWGNSRSRTGWDWVGKVFSGGLFDFSRVDQGLEQTYGRDLSFLGSKNSQQTLNAQRKFAQDTGIWQQLVHLKGGEAGALKELPNIIQEFGKYHDSSSDDAANRNAFANAKDRRAYFINWVKNNVSGMGDLHGVTDWEGMDKDMVSFLSGGQDAAHRRLNELSQLKNTMVQGAMHQARQQSYIEKQSILEAQRKYGITGAAAYGQWLNYDLKHQQQMANIWTQANAQAQQLYGNQMAAAQQIVDNERAMAVQRWASAVQRKGVNDIGDVRSSIRDYGLDENMLGDKSLQWVIDNQYTLGDYFKGGIDPTAGSVIENNPK